MGTNILGKYNLPGSKSILIGNGELLWLINYDAPSLSHKKWLSFDQRLFVLTLIDKSRKTHPQTEPHRKTLENSSMDFSRWPVFDWNCGFIIFSVTSMLVTDVENQMFWWQVTSSHQHQKLGTEIGKQSPT